MINLQRLFHMILNMPIFTYSYLSISKIIFRCFETKPLTFESINYLIIGPRALNTVGKSVDALIL